MNKFIYIIILLLSGLSAFNPRLEISKKNVKNSNRSNLIRFIKSNEINRGVIIEDFENVTLNLISHGEDDVDSSDWILSNFTPDTLSQTSLVLFGNTWKDQILDSISIHI